MPSISQLKERGKTVFKATYWRSVLVALILSIVAGGGASASGTRSANSEDLLYGFSPEILIAIVVAALGVSVVALLLDIFLFNPLEVGCQRFFLVNSRQPAELGELGFSFKNGYGNIVLTTFLRDLFLVLWTCLFIIPGIIKAYSYRMVPYILAENPEIKGTDAITLSRQMMDGHKWEAFVLDLSFIGWWLLSVLTLGILAIFWTAPYEYATDAEYYNAVRYNFNQQQAAAAQNPYQNPYQNPDPGPQNFS